ncbi:MAG: propionate catabolism operon regulatory protein PrpR [Herminiimonas sp.]|nr:propionate catabolism operon regulatory protein PrpR [Herminiimonas sp.]
MASRPLPNSIRPRICFLAYRHIALFGAPIVAEYADRTDIEVVEGAFEVALAQARERVHAGLVDVFVSAGSNAAMLRNNLQAPVAIIQLDGFSLLQALIKARSRSTRVGVVMYGRTIPELDDVKDLLKLEIVQYAYQTLEDARHCFERLRADGFNVIVGSSLVVEMAEDHGLFGLLAYSLNGLRRAFDDAIELARVTRLESGRYQQLNAVLGNLQDPVLAVDRQHRIIAVNPRMQELLDKTDTPLLGKSLDVIEPELSLTQTIQSGVEERALVLRFARRDWIANRTPIREHGDIVGAAVTLYDAQKITEADTTLRMQQRKRQVSAKYSFADLLGSSPAFERAINTARRFARTDMTVLIVGESGVGKELFAQAIHNDSARAGQPFVALNCAAFPEPLLESELFGYEEGAFSGSRRGGKRGMFETAHTGTLFLDEIGDMPLSLQTRLLRVLQEREITRVGGVVTIPIDVRVIAATHQPLQEMIAARQFRQDLYYRINTLRLPLPTLRERPADLELLAQTLVARAMKRLGSLLETEPIMAPLLPYLSSYAWPGNVRELENIANRIAVFLLQFSPGETISYDGLREDCPELFLPAHFSATDENGDAELRVTEALRSSEGNRTLAAQRLGISRSTLWRRMQKQIK